MISIESMEGLQVKLKTLEAEMKKKTNIIDLPQFDLFVCIEA